MAFDPDKPYNDLPMLPLTTDVEIMAFLDKIETKAILRRCIRATGALATLQAAGDLIPNQSILINAVQLQEAQGSSEIEQIITTQEKVYEAELFPEKADSQAKEVLRYRQALWAGYQSLSDCPLSVRTFTKVCQEIKDQPGIDVRKTPGTKLHNPDTKEVVYTPPEGESRLRDLLSNLEKLYHDEAINANPLIGDIDPLIRLAVGHYQFEAIHPFPDGNGRTGRIINILYLIEKGLLKIPVLYLSRRIIESKEEYYRLLREVTEKQAWEPWVLYMLDAVENTAKETTRIIYAVRDLFDETVERCRNDQPRIPHQLIEEVFASPYSRVVPLAKKGIAERQTISKYLKWLVEQKMLISTTFGREHVYINHRLLNVLRK